MNYRKDSIPTIFITPDKDIGKVVEDVFRYLNAQNDNLDILLNGGLQPGENFDAVHVSYTSNAVVDTQDTVAHTLGKAPTGVIVVDIDKGGVVYKSTAHDADNLYLKCTVASAAVKLLVY